MFSLVLVCIGGLHSLVKLVLELLCYLFYELTCLAKFTENLNKLFTLSSHLDLSRMHVEVKFCSPYENVEGWSAVRFSLIRTICPSGVAVIIRSIFSCLS